MNTCSRRLTFCAGHRVMGHENKCAHPHGHNYVAIITVSAFLDSVGRVVDFAVIKDKLGTWIDAQWDHAFICHVDDRALIDFLRDNKFKFFPLPYNPTAENMAQYLFNVAVQVLGGGNLTVVSVEVQETENCTAKYQR